MDNLKLRNNVLRYLSAFCPATLLDRKSQVVVKLYFVFRLVRLALKGAFELYLL